ncbi:MAG: YafY family transcriptional regulator [Ktedonobacteraceae bacterium]|nr:YafY family transcriptional regulator [Ktedonobacteraceae bacterium]
MQKTERLMAITLLLQGRGKMTARQLADILGVSVRTIYRDIMALSLAHVPVSMDYGPGGGYYLPDDYHIESAIFTQEEAVSLVLSADMAGNYSLFAGDDDLHRAVFKLEASLPEEYRANVRAAREHIVFDTTAWSNNDTPPAHLETLRAAVLEAHPLDILSPCPACKGGNRVKWRRVEPYGLVFKGVTRRHARAGVWYLVAFCRECRQFNPFRVNYIEKLKVRKEPVTQHPDFDLRAYWREARQHLEEQEPPFTLKLRVSSRARYSLWGDYTIQREEPDASVIALVEVESLEAGIAYALSLGAEATVLCPGRVRRAVAETALKIARLYAS